MNQIKTREQALAVIRDIDRKPVRTHRDTVVAGRIREALHQVDIYEDWGRQIAAHDKHGDVTLRGQATIQRGEYWDTRMSDLAHRLAKP